MADFVPMDKKPPLDKVVLVGSPGVGKSTIFQRFRTGKFVAADQFSHRDRAEHSKEWTVSETKVSMTLYDTAGVERHTQTMLPTYFRRAKAVIMVYSIDNEESFDDIGSNWLDNAESTDVKTVIVLVGNKVDLYEGGDNSRRVSKERAIQYALQNDIEKNMVFEVSAKTGRGVEQMFDAVARMMGPPPAAADTPPDTQPGKNCSSC